jgi:hypothetical protein
MKLSLNFKPVLLGFLAVAMAGLPGMASAQEYEGRPVEAVATRMNKDLRDRVELRRSLTTNIDRVITTYRWETVQVPRTVCTTEPGDGNNNWNGFFNVPKAQKPAALAATVKGIGQSTAQKMVDGGFFHSKPRSWEEFKAEIMRAENAIGTGFSHEVLVTYGTENMRNLGYYSEQTCKIVYDTVNVRREYKQREHVRTVTSKFTIILEGSALLNGEREDFTISYDGFRDSLGVSSRYNQYTSSRQQAGDTVIYRLRANRLRVTPANSLVVNLENNGGRMSLNIADQAYDAEMGSQLGQTVLVASIYQSRFGFDKKVAVIEKVINLTNQFTRLDTTFAPVRGKDIYVTYSLRRVGSRYHNANPSPAQNSNKIRF